MLAIVPLQMAPWGIAIVQPEKDVFAPATKLKKTFVAFFAAALGISLLIALGMSRSIVKPVHELIDATVKIASGDMSKPIEFGGVDEIGILSSSFEVMRLRLADSLEALQKYNNELETMVGERTREIMLSRKRVETLLKKAISAQEDERRRIARELHDDTLQALSAVLMRIDMCRLFPEKVTEDKIGQIRSIVLNAHDDVLAIIRNLRPSLLDDLGLESAVQWLLDTHLGPKGIDFYFKSNGADERKIRPEVEIALFRIMQEAIANIARHSEASHVFVNMKSDMENFVVDIEDDGRGFDVQSYCERGTELSKDGAGLGLLGMKERASLINGRVQIFSTPGFGTRVTLIVPLHDGGEIRV
jgi:signal transduction histidine kinase